MDIRQLLTDGIERSRLVCHDVVDGLPVDALNRPPRPGANPIAWLIWHLARQQDVQIASLAGTQDVWRSQGWYDRLGFDLPPGSMGYEHTPSEVARVRVDDPALLLGYLDAAVDATKAYVAGLDAAALDDVVDEAYDPPVTRGVRLVSVVDDAAQHAGQAAYVRGLLDG